MNTLNNQKILITGASAGIGRAVAWALADKGAELYLLARREAKLKELLFDLQVKFPEGKFHLILGDISDMGVQERISTLELDVLFNNAGLARGRDRVEDSKLSDWQEMIQTNITANFMTVHSVLGPMIARKKGDIINLCSIAGHATYPGGAVYCATKHAVLAFTKVLREETCGKNIRVMQISPGMVNTEFSTVRFHGDKKAADAVYADMTPLSGEDIARMVVFMLESPRHVVIDEIITMPLEQGSATTISRKARHP